MFDGFGKYIVKHSKKLIIAATIVLTFVALLNFYFLFFISPQSNDECLWIPKKVSPDSAAIYFDLVKFEGVTWEAGIRDGDQLLAINGKDIYNTFGAQIILNTIEKGDSALYKVSRHGEILTTKVRIKQLYSFAGIGAALFGFIWLIVGFVVVMAKPDGRLQFRFYLIGALSTLFSMFSFFTAGLMQNSYLNITWLTQTIDIFWLASASFLPFVLVHFFWNFPHERPIMKKKYTAKILNWTPVIILFISLAVRFLLFYVFETSFLALDFFKVFLLYYLHTGLVFVAILIGLVSLFLSYIKLKTKKERDSIFIILIAYAIGVAVIIYNVFVANAIADTIFNEPEYFMPIIAIAIIPVAFGYSIFKYSLMDVTDVVKNAIMYGIATVFVAGIYIFVVYLLGQSISNILGTDYQGIIFAVVFILFALIFQSTKDRFQEIVTRKFYPEQFAHQQVLMKFSADVSSVVGLDNILDLTVNTFVDSLKIRTFGIALRSNNSDDFALKRSRGIKKDNFVLENRDRKIKIFIDAKNSLRQYPVIERTDFEKVFTIDAQLLIEEEIYTVIPLLIKSKLVGLLLFGLKHSGAQFAGKDLELLVAAANQAAVAVENARLYLSEAEKLRMDRDLENAKRIQESLLPSKIPEVKRLSFSGKMIPAWHIGGDYFDFIKISDTKLFVVIGDVSGKGLSASFYMSKLQTMIRLFSREGKSPKEILCEINKQIYSEMERNWFITVSIALFDSDKMETVFCRAGHTPLIVNDANGEKEYQPKGIGIGLEKGEIFDASLEEINIALNTGQTFLFYSDGVTEAMDSDNNLYGEVKLKSVLLESSNNSDSKSILTEIIKSVDNFIDGRAHNDDITLAVVKIK